MATLPRITRELYDAVLFDLDGVLTTTAKLHAAAWKETFDELLQRRAAAEGRAFVPFDPVADYHKHVDGKPRLDGVKSFLAARHVELPYGTASDPPSAQTICGVGNRKNERFHAIMGTDGVEVYPSSIEALKWLRQHGFKLAVVSSSRNCAAVLAAAGIAALLDVRVDGQTSPELPGKPQPDTFLAAARALAVEPSRAVVVEDALAGVEAGKRGGFGLVVGIARAGNADALKQHGADVVVTDLAEFLERGSAAGGVRA